MDQVQPTNRGAIPKIKSKSRRKKTKRQTPAPVTVVSTQEETRLLDVPSDTIWRPNVDPRMGQELKLSQLDSSTSYTVGSSDNLKIHDYLTLKIPEAAECNSTPANTPESVIGPADAVTTLITPTPASLAMTSYASTAVDLDSLVWSPLFPTFLGEPQIDSDGLYTFIIKSLPNWTYHFRVMCQNLGYKLNARTYGSNIQFLPRTIDEYLIVRSYLLDLSEIEPAMSWGSHASSYLLPINVGIRGLPFGTPITEIKNALQARGFPVQFVGPVNMSGRGEYLYYVELDNMTEEELIRLFATHELLLMSEVMIEDWRSTEAQCYLHRTFEDENLQDTEENDHKNSLPGIEEEKETRDEAPTETEDIKQEKEKDGWTILLENKSDFQLSNTSQVFPPLPTPKKTFGEDLKFDKPVAKTWGATNDSILCNERLSNGIEASNKKRRGRKGKRNPDKPTHASSSFQTNAPTSATSEPSPTGEEKVRKEIIDEFSVIVIQILNMMLKAIEVGDNPLNAVLKAIYLVLDDYYGNK